MNKMGVETVKAIVGKVKMCILGKISEDFEKRLPPKVDEWDNIEKYNFIKSGEAKLKFIPRKTLMGQYDKPLLTSSFIYPDKPETQAYDEAKALLMGEKIDRELAVELAFNRLANERILEMIDSKTFLDRLDVMASQEW
jgi:hypothetical protein